MIEDLKLLSRMKKKIISDFLLHFILASRAMGRKDSITRSEGKEIFSGILSPYKLLMSYFLSYLN